MIGGAEPFVFLTDLMSGVQVRELELGEAVLPVLHAGIQRRAGQRGHPARAAARGEPQRPLPRHRVGLRGALHGETALPPAWLAELEGRATLNPLARAAHGAAAQRRPHAPPPPPRVCAACAHRSARAVFRLDEGR
ncbi:hypothetical protein GCM10010284_06860 [Streptomyces rubiginosohelvolus]|nr:hypothetical protein GCM10010284_06860 [Streptomyces rubiginosohelvolus]